MASASPGSETNSTPANPPTDPRFINGLPDNADHALRGDFVKFCIQNYKAMNWHTDTLSEYYADDFSTFTAYDFNNIASNDRRTLLDCLRKRGVYVRKGRGIQIADALIEVIKDDIPWPANESIDDCEFSPAGRSRTSTADSQSAGNRTQGNQISGNITSNANHEQQRSGNSPSQIGVKRSDGNFQHDGNGNSQNRGNISNLEKSYHGDADRYNGMPSDNFDRKLSLFNENCDQSNVAESEKHRALSIMLTGRARDFYLDNFRGKDKELDEMTAAVKRRFITAEHERQLVREWDNLSLHSGMAENIGKSKEACLEQLVGRMHTLQSAFPSAYSNEEIF